MFLVVLMSVIIFLFSLFRTYWSQYEVSGLKFVLVKLQQSRQERRRRRGFSSAQPYRSGGSASADRGIPWVCGLPATIGRWAGEPHTTTELNLQCFLWLHTYPCPSGPHNWPSHDHHPVTKKNHLSLKDEEDKRGDESLKLTVRCILHVLLLSTASFCLTAIRSPLRAIDFWFSLFLATSKEESSRRH